MASRTASRLLSTSARLRNACAGSTSAPAPSELPVAYHLFRQPLPYLVGLQLQNDIIDVRLAEKAKDPESTVARQDVMLLLEHLPTYTTGRRDSSPHPDTLHPEEKKVQHVGAEFHITKRGGQVTYHGPGQLVGYPIFDLNAMGISTRCYVSYIQDILAAHVRDGFGIPVHAPHPDGHVGVFASPTEKLASIGIHLRHRISSHGFSFNVTPEPLKWFDLVLACGLADVKAISLADMLRRAGTEAAPSVEDTARALVPRFGERFARQMTPLEEAAGGASRDSAGARAIYELVQRAEAESERQIGSGGWRTEPDVAGRSDLPGGEA